MLTNEELTELELKYFRIIENILARSLGKIISDVNSQKNFEDLNGTEKTNPIESKAENTIENIISNQLNWDVCSLPISSDSCYSCGDAIVHIDVKTTLDIDDDSPEKLNRLNIEAAQTSYIYGEDVIVTSPYSGRGKRPKPANWSPKLKMYEKHQYFGEVPNLTYFVRVIYSENNLVEKLSLLCVPNGQLNKKFDGIRILNGGKSKTKDKKRFTNIRILVNELEKKEAWRNSILYTRKGQ